MLTVTPFLLFDGNCAEAMRFYQVCLGGELTLTALGETPMKAQFAAAEHHKISFAVLRSGQVEITATDWLHPVRQRRPGNTAGIFVSGANFEELADVFAKLSEGAEQDSMVPLQQMPFGVYGRFTDRYGVEWFFRG